MTPDFWLQRWQDNRIGFHQTQINTHLENYWPRLDIPSGGTVFVPLCGKSLDMLWLAGQGYRVLGVELSPLAVDAFFTENGLKPDIHEQQGFRHYLCGEIEIICGDFFALTRDKLASVSAVYDRASLIALPPDMRARYAEHLRTVLPGHRPILLITLDYPQDERQGPPFAVGDDEVRTLYSGHWQIQRIASRDLRNKDEPVQLSRFDEHVFVLL